MAFTFRHIPVLGGLMMLSAMASAAQAPGLLRQLEPGAWELRARGEPQVRRLCVANPEQLLQVEHPRSQCQRYVLAETDRSLSVSYECGGAGSGRTDIRIETSRLAQIRSQGVAGGAPFAWNMEARRVGACQ